MSDALKDVPAPCGPRRRGLVGYYGLYEVQYPTGRSPVREGLHPEASEGVAAMSYATDRCELKIPRVVALALHLYEQEHPSEVKAAKKKQDLALKEVGMLQFLVEPLPCSVAEKGMNEIKARLRKQGLA